MSPAQIAQAQRLTREWKPSSPNRSGGLRRMHVSHSLAGKCAGGDYLAIVSSVQPPP
jgi:hypothetical protein